MKEDGPKRPNKRLLYYYGIILLITILLNALVMPALAERSVTEVTYDQFLDMLDIIANRKPIRHLPDCSNYQLAFSGFHLVKGL